MSTGGLGRLRRLAVSPVPPAADAAGPGAADERCEFCAVALGERHGHVADTAEHRLLCVCRPCYLLFEPKGAGGARFRAVGEDVRRVGDLALTDAEWDALRVPVDLVFFLRQGERQQAFYPGPGGATESELDLRAWADITTANPVLAEVAPDVEAVLLRRDGGGFSCYLVPVDLCYALVGLVRARWTGLGGGPEVWSQIAAYFADLDERSRKASRVDSPSRVL